MATKKITGQSKLAQTAESKTDTNERLDLVTPRKKPSLKAYRLYDDDIARLKEITATMNKESHRHISETAAIRALIVLGTGTTGEKLLKALRETI
ncbi:hypothetical protein JWG42_01115 [Desulfoprunum benzoelyticum]|uniref:Uncharacterized protein n=1 Tax=Desulfoprunum benzoelyticum TaxID=1506996 RepID=A0A840UQ75_9BACT|nr:hypothetical protein [Desulfoprunum benzoelyticum]MBB5348387.1 hypothetical protein [Desulfoprunum benzoelyticum]MBM9528755.1 hypothetical protein [Desulfoprunum benzoelyticum]